MSKNRRNKNELPSQEKSFQHILNRNTSTFILKHLRLGTIPVAPSFCPRPPAPHAWALGEPSRTLHPPRLGSLTLLCTTLSVKWALSLQKMWCEVTDVLTNLF